MPQATSSSTPTSRSPDKSAYTVMVVRRIDLHDGPNLALNSDYSASDVPVPQGVGMLTN